MTKAETRKLKIGDRLEIDITSIISKTRQKDIKMEKAIVIKEFDAYGGGIVCNPIIDSNCNLPMTLVPRELIFPSMILKKCI